MTLPQFTVDQRRSRRAAAVRSSSVAAVVVRRGSRAAVGAPAPRATRPAKSRWIVIAAYGLLAAATQALLVTYAPVTNDAARHFGVSVAAVGWLSQVFPLLYVLLAIPAGVILDRSFRSALLLGALLTTGGAFVRLVSDDYAWALAGQVVAALGQPFVLNAITALAVGYVVEKDRTTGIALGSSAVFGGMVVGYLLGAVLPGTRHIHTLTVITAVIAAAAGLGLIVALRLVRPLARPDAVPTAGGLRAFRAAFGNGYVRRLCVLATIPMGAFIALATYAQPLLAPAGVSESSAGLILALTMVAGVVGCAVVPVWAERHRREIGVMGAALAVTTGACLYLAVLPGEVMAYVMLIALGFALLPALPIVLALSERHAPDAESTAAGLIWLSGNLGSVVIATAIGLLVTHPSTAFVALPGVTVLALPALRWYARFDAA